MLYVEWGVPLSGGACGNRIRGLVMKRIITTSVALIIAFSITAGSEAEAGRRNKSHRRAYKQQRANNGGGFFDRIMEVERNKNAWLKRTFLGR